MDQEFRVIGPPGCGKTTWLSRQVARAWEGGKEVMIASLTRAAAAEVAGRDLPIPQDAVGTLHAHCYRVLGRPEIAETKATYIDDWNEANPGYRMSTGSTDIDDDNTDGFVGKENGDKLMAEYGVLRARMATVMPASVMGFAKRWKEWKESSDLVDFTDLIEIAVDSVSTAPGSPDVIFIDEGQDMDALEMALIRKWGEKAGYLVVVGDPDQNLYQWRGSDPEAFFDSDLRPDQTMVLEQSYRVPWAVHGVAVDWIDKIVGREPVDYIPRDEDGEVLKNEGTFRSPGPILEGIERNVADGKTVMVLASCSYMLSPIIKLLREAGLPYHNPYRRKRGDWNPLAKRAKSVSGAEHLLAFLEMSRNGRWTAEDMGRWGEAVKVRGVLANGRDDLALMYDVGETGVPWEVLNYLVSEEAVSAGLSGDMAWYYDRLLATKKRGAAFPIRVAERDPELLGSLPLVTVGTIHSVKGGEADVVYLMPDLSMGGFGEWRGEARHQAAVRRLFYVGMTRARETLVICTSVGTMAVNI